MMPYHLDVLPMFLSRCQRARLATFLATPRWLLMWIWVMGGAVALVFVWGAFNLVWGNAHSIALSRWLNVIPALNSLLLGLRGLVLGSGWLPVSVDELDRDSIHLDILPAEQQQAFLKQVRELRWLSWKEAWVVLGGRPGFFNVSGGWGCQRWLPGKYHVARSEHFLTLVPLAVRRSDKGVAASYLSIPMTKARVRA